VASDFNDLAAYRLARALARDVYSAVGRWPEFDRSTVGMQVVRSTDSVAANIAEGTGRWTKADRRRFLLIARGSLLETEHWLNTARERGLLRGDPGDRVAEIARALNGLIKQPAPK
jgi:four helix bundle protein